MQQIVDAQGLRSPFVFGGREGDAGTVQRQTAGEWLGEGAACGRNRETWARNT